MPPNRAIEAAIALAQHPRLRDAMRVQPIPPGIRDLLAILAGDAPASAEFLSAARVDEGFLRAALQLYVQEVMLFRGAPPRRVLGVGAAATRAEMRDHLRLLMAWLHPDVADDPWRAPFAARVLAAWRDVNTHEVATMQGEAGVSGPPEGPRRGLTFARPSLHMACIEAPDSRRDEPAFASTRTSWLIATCICVLAAAPFAYPPVRTWIVNVAAEVLNGASAQASGEFLGARHFQDSDLTRMDLRP